METGEDLAFASASELRGLIASKKVSPVELTELYLRRMERLNPRLNAYLTVTAEAAMESARAAEEAVARGDRLGPLHGLPVSIKDLEITNGVRTTGGSLVYRDRVLDEDSVVVERVRKAGAVILGKTNTPEFGLSGTTENRLGDACRNPWNAERTSGGSSGGAGAAVVAGLCSLATGGDGGGSIRIPASFCGIYGIKPAQGRVPRYSGANASVVLNQLAQSGPMTRTVRDSALLLQVLSGHDPRDPSSRRDDPPDYPAALDKPIKGLRIAWSRDYGYAAVDPEVVGVAYKAAMVFEELGCSVEETDLALDSPFEAFWTIFSTNAYAAYGHLLEGQADQLTKYARRALEHGVTVTGADYARALGYVERLKSQFLDLFERYDLLLSPTMAVTAFPVERHPSEIAGRAVNPFWGFLPFTFPINMVGHMAASIPCGFSPEGMPVGLHIVGSRDDEETVIAASAAFERARPWINRRPPVS